MRIKNYQEQIDKLELKLFEEKTNRTKWENIILIFILVILGLLAFSNIKLRQEMKDYNAYQDDAINDALIETSDNYKSIRHLEHEVYGR